MGRSAPLSERICDLACAVFALWTLASHAIVAAGGSLYHLLGLFAVALVGAAILAYRLRSRSASEPAPAPDAPPAATVGVGLRATGFALGAAAALAFALHGSVFALWWCAVLLLGAAALAVAREAPRMEPALRGRGPEAALFAMAFGCAAIALICHRPDMDDSFYVNLAAAAADRPLRPLLSGDTLHGVPGLPLIGPQYRLHSYELANAALSFVSGIPVIYSFHWLSAAGAALLLPLVHARLFRLLVPRAWPWAVLALLVVLVGAGETHRWYGNFSLVRMWQGKGICLFVFLPLVYAYALRFGARPTLRHWLWLVASQIAALGCSSLALFAVPAGAGVALASAIRPSLAGLRTLALGLLASGYLLGMGLLFRGEMQGFLEPWLTEHPPGAQLDQALGIVLGHGRLRLLGLAAMLTAWACCPAALGRRWAALFPLAVSLVFLNPYWDDWVSANVTGPSYWRILWSLPIPVLMALLLVAPLQLRGIGPLACALLLAAYVDLVPRYGGLSERNGGFGTKLHLGWPGLKVPREPYRWATALNDSVPPGSQVVAPIEIGMWVTTFHDHAYPVVVRRVYLHLPKAHLGEENVRRRRAMTRYVEGKAQAAAAPVFREGLAHFDVKGVCLRESPLAAEARDILRATGFARVMAEGEHEIWTRP